jgi:hypothetical protein
MENGMNLNKEKGKFRRGRGTYTTARGRELAVACCR